MKIKIEIMLDKQWNINKNSNKINSNNLHLHN